jgi:hypothetical protein
MNKLKTILKVICGGVILYALFGVGLLCYSVLWMRPHAERALNEFKKSVTEGTKIETVKAIASKVGADEYHAYALSQSEDGASEEAAVYFFRFPGGLARDVCRIKFKNGAAISIKYYFRG